MSRTYSNGEFSVTVGRDGSIAVKKGDSLSKYSMAIHGDSAHLDEYFRKVGGELKRIVDVNRIYQGETIFHICSVVTPARSISIRQTDQFEAISKRKYQQFHTSK